MRTKLLFRQHPATVPTQTWRGRARQAIRDLATPVIGVVLLFSVFLLAGYLDETSRMRDEALQLQRQAQLLRVYEAGREAGNREMLDSAQAAWEAAQAEAKYCAVRRGL